MGTTHVPVFTPAELSPIYRICISTLKLCKLLIESLWWIVDIMNGDLYRRPIRTVDGVKAAVRANIEVLTSD